MPMRKIIIYTSLLLLSATRSDAQTLTLDKAIQIAQENSFDAQVARFSFMASYWTFRSYKANLLPAMNLSGGLMNFNHSLVDARNYEDGR